ncbi:MAG TPA: dienelactone hydrolase family protein [Candidatus Binatia bacterium]|nr:dienelactone hydrolase family protein [Candidatus Binatia bacterium]
MPHYLARAAAPTAAGVLLLPHVYGVNEFVRGFATGLAERGLTTVAWNPYPQLPMGSKFTERPPRPKDEATMQTLSGLVDFMLSKLGLSAVATIGFCMGGRWVLMFGAREPRLRAAVACYPSIPAQRSPGQDVEPLPVAAAIACPVLVIYPGLDNVTPRPVFEALQAMLQGRAASTSVIHYPDAEHGFMHAPGPANDAATRSATPQIYGFFDAYLSSS